MGFEAASAPGLPTERSVRESAHVKCVVFGGVHTGREVCVERPLGETTGPRNAGVVLELTRPPSRMLPLRLGP